MVLFQVTTRIRIVLQVLGSIHMVAKQWRGFKGHLLTKNNIITLVITIKITYMYPKKSTIKEKQGQLGVPQSDIQVELD